MLKRKKYRNGSAGLLGEGLGNQFFGSPIQQLPSLLSDNPQNANLIDNKGVNSVVDSVLPAADLLLPGLGTGLSLAKKGLESLGVFGESDEEKQRKQTLELNKQRLSQDKSSNILAGANLTGTSNTLFRNGGSLNKLSSINTEVVGPSHEQGGVKLPSLNAELEGGETTSGDFVFSEELGFAKKHKPIAKAIGRTEKLLEINPNDNIASNTLNRLLENENQLKIDQETLKENLGIPSGEVEKARFGGNIKKLDKLGSDTDTLIDINNLNNTIGSAIKPLNSVEESNVAGKASGSSILNAINESVPFVSNFANSLRKLPEVPAPVLQPRVNQKLINLDASRNDANRKSAALGKAVSRQAPGIIGANNRAGILSNNINQLNKINQAEQTENANIINRGNLINSRITSQNVGLLNQFNADNLNRNLNTQRLSSENIANLTNKLQLRRRDKDLINLEDRKLNASLRPFEGSGILKRNLQDLIDLERKRR